MRQKKIQENAHLYNSMIMQKQEMKRYQSETQKILDVFAPQCNDTLLEKGMHVYQQIVQKKEQRNQLILKAQRERTIRNFSTVEHEKTHSLVNLFQKQQEQVLQKQNTIHEERHRIQKKNYQKKGRADTQHGYGSEQIRMIALEFAGQEQKNRVIKKEQYCRMLEELDQLINARKERQMEKERALNMVEFSMNMNRLKKLGIFNKEGMEQFYKQRQTSHTKTIVVICKMHFLPKNPVGVEEASENNIIQVNIINVVFIINVVLINFTNIEVVHVLIVFLVTPLIIMHHLQV